MIKPSGTAFLSALVIIFLLASQTENMETFKLFEGMSEFILVGGREVIITYEEAIGLESARVTCSIDGELEEGTFGVGDVVLELPEARVVLEKILKKPYGPPDALFKVSGDFTLRKWTIMTVDSEGDVGLDTSIALDSKGYPHISYSDWTNRDLKYARWDGSRWRIERVDWKDEVGRYTSIALDANDYPHISYWDATNDDLKYARWTGTGWEIGVVDSEGKVGSCASMALDSKGYPHISYWDDTAACLKYARWTGGDWRIEVIDNIRGERLEISLALDSDDRPHISYIADHPAEGYYELLKYARWAGAGWKVEVVDNEGIGCRWVHMVLDSGDRPHIVYYFSPPRVNGPPGEWLKYAHWTGAEWKFEVIDTVGPGGSPPGPAIALDSADNPHIAYLYLRSMLKYARWTGSGWEFEIIDNEGWVGGETSLALDENNRPHISYFDYDYRNLKYATLSEAIQPIEPQPRPIVKIAAIISVIAVVAVLGILWRWRMG